MPTRPDPDAPFDAVLAIAHLSTRLAACEHQEAPMQPFTVFADTRVRGVCRGCGAPLDWYKTLQERRMPVTRDAVPVAAGVEPISDRPTFAFDAAAAHWAHCSHAAAFRRRK